MPLKKMNEFFFKIQLKIKESVFVFHKVEAASIPYQNSPVMKMNFH